MYQNLLHKLSMLLISTSEPWFLKTDHNLGPCGRFRSNYYLRHTREGCCVF